MTLLLVPISVVFSLLWQNVWQDQDRWKSFSWVMACEGAAHHVRGYSPPREERHCRVCGSGRVKWRTVHIMSARKQSMQAGTKDGCYHQRFASSDMVLPIVKDSTAFKIALQVGIWFHNISACVYWGEAFIFKYHLCLYPPPLPLIPRQCSASLLYVSYVVYILHRGKLWHCLSSLLLAFMVSLCGTSHTWALFYYYDICVCLPIQNLASTWWENTCDIFIQSLGLGPVDSFWDTIISNVEKVKVSSLFKILNR